MDNFKLLLLPIATDHNVLINSCKQTVNKDDSTIRTILLANLSGVNFHALKSFWACSNLSRDSLSPVDIC